MGQRLNIEIVKNNKVLANAYYHWSAYSSSSIILLKKIIDSFDYIRKYGKNLDEVGDRDLLLAIRLLEETGAGLTEIELKMAKEKFGSIYFKECEGRNEGLIAISAKGIKETEDWEEGRITVDIEKETFDFGVYYTIDDADMDEYEGETFVEQNINFKGNKFENVYMLEYIIKKSCYKREYHFKNTFDNTYNGWKE